jgi:hypothetical protein
MIQSDEHGRINLWPPALVVHDSDRPRLGASAQGPVIFVRANHRDNDALLAHELEHVRQWWVAGLIGAVLGALLGAVVGWQASSYVGLLPAVGADPIPAVVGALLGLPAHSWLMLISTRYRLWCEIRGYRVQLRHKPAEHREHYRRVYADMLANSYELGLTPDQAAEALR